jgi:hypothetical protein
MLLSANDKSMNLYNVDIHITRIRQLHFVIGLYGYYLDYNFDFSMDIYMDRRIAQYVVQIICVRRLILLMRNITKYRILYIHYYKVKNYICILV